MSRFLDLVNERVVIYDGATGTNLQSWGSPPTTSAAPSSRAATRSSSITRPDVIADLHESFFEVGVDVVETDTFGAFAVPLDEYGIADRAHEISLAAARDRPRGRRRLRRAAWPARSARAPSCRRWARSASPSCATPTRSGPGPARGRRRPAHHRDRLRPAGRQGRDHRRPPGDGRRRPPGPDPGAGHDRAHGPHAARHRDRRRPHRPRRPAARRHRAQLRHRPGRDAASTCATCRPTPACRSRASPTPGCRRWSTARCTTTSPPTSSPTTTTASSPSSACRSSAAAAAPRPSTSRRLASRGRTSPRPGATPATSRAAASIYTTVPFHQDTSFLIIGERTNANGSKKFRDAMLDGDWDTCVAHGPATR